MTRVEAVARLMALENDEPEENWQKYNDAAYKGLRAVPLTLAECHVEVTPAWYEYGKKLLKTTEGRYEMIEVCREVREELNKRQ